MFTGLSCHWQQFSLTWTVLARKVPQALSWQPKDNTGGLRAEARHIFSKKMSVNWKLLPAGLKEGSSGTDKHKAPKARQHWVWQVSDPLLSVFAAVLMLLNPSSSGAVLAMLF